MVEKITVILYSTRCENIVYNLSSTNFFQTMTMQDPTAIQMNNEYASISNALESMVENSSIIETKTESMLLNASAIRSFLNSKSIAHKRFVLIETNETYEIVRMIDDSSTEFFYSKLKPFNKANFGDIDAFLIKILNKFISTDHDRLGKIDGNLSLKMKNLNIVTHGYLQRSTSTAKPFRYYVDGPTKALHDSVFSLKEKGFIEELGSSYTEKEFNTKAKMYKILKTE